MKTKDRQIGWHLFLVVVVFLLLMPIVFAISNSFKTMQEAFNTVFQVIPLHPTMENYRHVFDKLPFVKITLNTFLIASTVTIFKTITGLLAAYAFVYFRFKGKGFLYFIMLSTLFIPFTVTMIPNYLLISKIGLRDRIWGVALPQLADVLGIFLLRQAMRGIPLALQMYISAEGGTEFTIAMAVSVLTMLIPLVLYIIFQRYIINTFAASGLKG